MPELPEVETVRQGLATLITGDVIRSVELRRADLRFPFPRDFAERLTGRTIERIDRRAKYLAVMLDDGTALIIHLGMSGSLRVEAPRGDWKGLGTRYWGASKAAAHDHVVLHMSSDRTVTYNDPRRFGMMDLAPAGDLSTYPAFAKLGPEPLSNAFNGVVLAERLAGRRTPIKTALLDQQVVAGLGNIYVCEALWRARVSPKRSADTLVTRAGAPRVALDRLVAAIRDILSEAISAGGSSLRDHIQASGEIGGFQLQFSVYDREGEACPRDGCRGIVRRLTQGGRSTFHCPSCQR